MTETAYILTEYVAGEWAWRSTPCRLSPTHDEIAQLAFSLYESSEQPQ
jgi:hypothetical protein